jgi:hypothetical protein
MYAYIRGPIHKDYLPKSVAHIELHALPGTIESLAGEDEQDTAEQVSAMRTFVQTDVKGLSLWSQNYLNTPHDSSQRPCDDEGYKAWEKATSKTLEGMAGVHNGKKGEDGIKFSVIDDPEDLKKVQEGKTYQLSYYFENKHAKSTQASTNK